MSKLLEESPLLASPEPADWNKCWAPAHLQTPSPRAIPRWQQTLETLPPWPLPAAPSCPWQVESAESSCFASCSPAKTPNRYRSHFEESPENLQRGPAPRRRDIGSSDGFRSTLPKQEQCLHDLSYVEQEEEISRFLGSLEQACAFPGAQKMKRDTDVTCSGRLVRSSSAGALLGQSARHCSSNWFQSPAVSNRLLDEPRGRSACSNEPFTEKPGMFDTPRAKRSHDSSTCLSSQSQRCVQQQQAQDSPRLPKQSGAAEPELPELAEDELAFACCSHCGRQFRQDRLPVHEGVCQAASSSGNKRQVFDSRRQRCASIEHGKWWLQQEFMRESKTLAYSPPEQRQGARTLEASSIRRPVPARGPLNESPAKPRRAQCAVPASRRSPVPLEKPQSPMFGSHRTSAMPCQQQAQQQQLQRSHSAPAPNLPRRQGLPKGSPITKREASPAAAARAPRTRAPRQRPCGAEAPLQQQRSAPELKPMGGVPSSARSHSLTCPASSRSGTPSRPTRRSASATRTPSTREPCSRASPASKLSAKNDNVDIDTCSGIKSRLRETLTSSSQSSSRHPPSRRLCRAGELPHEVQSGTARSPLRSIHGTGDCQANITSQIDKCNRWSDISSIARKLHFSDGESSDRGTSKTDEDSSAVYESTGSPVLTPCEVLDEHSNESPGGSSHSKPLRESFSFTDSTRLSKSSYRDILSSANFGSMLDEVARLGEQLDELLGQQSNPHLTQVHAKESPAEDLHNVHEHEEHKEFHKQKESKEWHKCIDPIPHHEHGQEDAQSMQELHLQSQQQWHVRQEQQWQQSPSPEQPTQPVPPQQQEILSGQQNQPRQAQNSTWPHPQQHPVLCFMECNIPGEDTHSSSMSAALASAKDFLSQECTPWSRQPYDPRKYCSMENPQETETQAEDIMSHRGSKLVNDTTGWVAKEMDHPFNLEYMERESEVIQSRLRDCALQIFERRYQMELQRTSLGPATDDNCSSRT